MLSLKSINSIKVLQEARRQAIFDDEPTRYMSNAGEDAHNIVEIIKAVFHEDFGIKLWALLFGSREPASSSMKMKLQIAAIVSLVSTYYRAIFPRKIFGSHSKFQLSGHMFETRDHVTALIE